MTDLIEPKCPECGVGVDRPRCVHELGSDCPRHELLDKYLLVKKRYEAGEIPLDCANGKHRGPFSYGWNVPTYADAEWNPETETVTVDFSTEKIVWDDRSDDRVLCHACGAVWDVDPEKVEDKGMEVASNNAKN